MTNTEIAEKIVKMVHRCIINQSGANQQDYVAEYDSMMKNIEKEIESVRGMKRIVKHCLTFPKMNLAITESMKDKLRDAQNIEIYYTTEE
jgi:hypothetical protein